jgi:hypothetical protein
LSDVEPTNNDAYTLSQKPWKSNVEGRLAAIISHQHDGAVETIVKFNNRTVCSTPASYGTTPLYVSPPMELTPGQLKAAPAMKGMSMKHISNMPVCYDADSMGKLNIGDTVEMTGSYDYKKHPAMLTDKGKPSDVMVISIMYVATTPIVAVA